MHIKILVNTHTHMPTHLHIFTLINTHTRTHWTLFSRVFVVVKSVFACVSCVFLHVHTLYTKAYWCIFICFCLHTHTFTITKQHSKGLPRPSASLYTIHFRSSRYTKKRRLAKYNTRYKCGRSALRGNILHIYHIFSTVLFDPYNHRTLYRVFLDKKNAYRFWFLIVLQRELFYNVCRPTCWIHNWFTLYHARRSKRFWFESFETDLHSLEARRVRFVYRFKYTSLSLCCVVLVLWSCLCVCVCGLSL